jgi:hypothetical protein
MRPIGGALDDHDAEFDEVRWVEVEEALAILNHDTERSVVEEAVAALSAAERPQEPMTGAEATA